MTGWTRWLFGALIVAGLVFLVLHLGEWRNFAVLARQAQPEWLLLAFALQLTTYGSLALSWRVVLHAGDAKKFKLIPLLRLALSKLFADQAMPTAGVSGNVLLIERLQGIGATRGTAMAALLISVRGYYAAYLVFALVSLLLLWLRGNASPLLVGLVTTFVLVALAIPALALWLRRRGSKPLPHLLERLGPIRQLLEMMATAPANLVSNRRLLLEVAAWNSLVFVADILTLDACLRGLGIELPVEPTFIAFILASVVVTLGPIPFGLGTFEATCTSLLHLLGAPIEGAFSAVFLLRFLTLWIPMVLGLLQLRRSPARKIPSARHRR